MTRREYEQAWRAYRRIRSGRANGQDWHAVRRAGLYLQLHFEAALRPMPTRTNADIHQERCRLLDYAGVIVACCGWLSPEQRAVERRRVAGEMYRRRYRGRPVWM